MPSLVSILIPTRNRPALARLAVDAALQAADDDTEVVVADNSDTPTSIDISDCRLRVLPHPSRTLSMPDNWERALAAAAGDWITIQGDKQRFVPGALQVLRRLTPSGHSAIRFATPQDIAFFQGLSRIQADDVDSLRAAPGTLTVRSQPSDSLVCESRPELERAFRIAGARFGQPRYAPTLYSAFVQRNVIDRIRRRTGRVFLGSCPDIASGLQVLAETQTYLSSNLPLVMTHYPNADSQWWSIGGSFMTGGEGADSFLAEFQQSPLAARRLPLLVTSAVVETMLTFAEAHPDMDCSPDWIEFARAAAREIECRAIGSRTRLQIALARALVTKPRGLAAIRAQMEATVAVHLPRAIGGNLAKLRRALLGIAAPKEHVAETDTRCAGSLQEALRFLGDQLDASLHSGIPTAGQGRRIDGHSTRGH